MSRKTTRRLLITRQKLHGNHPELVTRMPIHERYSGLPSLLACDNT